MVTGEDLTALYINNIKKKVAVPETRSVRKNDKMTT